MRRPLRRFMLAVALALAGPAGADAPPAPPAEAFAQLPFLSSPLLSPDGMRIAARVTADGAERIGVWTLSAPRDDPPAILPIANVDAMRWAGDRRLVISVTGVSLLGVGGVLLPLPYRRVLVHDLAANQTATLGEGEGLFDELIFVDEAGSYVLLATQESWDRTPAVHRVDLESGASVEVQPRRSGVWSWHADENGVVRVGIDYSERRTKIYYRAGPGEELRMVETRRNRPDDSVVDMVRLVNDTGRGFVVTNADTGRFALYEYDFSTDTRGAVRFEHPQVDVTAAIFGSDGDVDGVVYEDDRPRVHWFDADMERVQRAIDGALPGRTNGILNRSRDGNRVLIFSSAAADPGTWYVFDQAARQLEVFASPHAALQDLAFAPVRPVTYRSRDGLDIHGYLTLPAGRPETRLPLVVLPHGGPFLRDSWTFNPEVQFLASRGFAVLQPNFRGSTGYGRDFVERGYGQLGAGMIDDIDDGVDWLVREGVADPARVCIMGSSYGGYAAIWGAMRSPRRYRCAISWAGPTDLLAMMRHDARLLYAQRYVRERRRQLRGDEEVSLRAISPLRFPERLQVPLLIGHGERDQRVPAEQSRDFVRALARRGAAVESAFYPESGHDFGSSEDSADFLRRAEAFLARHNPADLPAPADAPAAAPAGLSISPVNR